MTVATLLSSIPQLSPSASPSSIDSQPCHVNLDDLERKIHSIGKKIDRLLTNGYCNASPHATDPQILHLLPNPMPPTTQSAKHISAMHCCIDLEMQLGTRFDAAYVRISCHSTTMIWPKNVLNIMWQMTSRIASLQTLTTLPQFWTSYLISPICPPPTVTVLDHPSNNSHMDGTATDQEIADPMDCMIWTLQTMVQKVEHTIYLHSCNNPQFLLSPNPKLASGPPQLGWMCYHPAFHKPHPANCPHHTIATCDLTKILVYTLMQHQFCPL